MLQGTGADQRAMTLARNAGGVLFDDGQMNHVIVGDSEDRRVQVAELGSHWEKVRGDVQSGADNVEFWPYSAFFIFATHQFSELKRRLRRVEVAADRHQLNEIKVARLDAAVCADHQALVLLAARVDAIAVAVQQQARPAHTALFDVPGGGQTKKRKAVRKVGAKAAAKKRGRKAVKK